MNAFEAGQQHQIDRLVWRVEVAGLQHGLALQERLMDLQTEFFQPVIERVFSQALPAHRHARLARLEVDLGTLPEAALEQDRAAALADALAQALAAALAAALAGLGETPNAAGEQVTSPAVAELERVEHYLLHGVLPYRPAEARFDAAALLAKVSAAQLAGMAMLLRRHAGAPQVLERLVLQASEATLRRLLAGLETAHATLILAYLADLRGMHREQPVVALDDTAFGALLWLITLRYLTAAGGSQFNRKSYLGSLLRQVSEATGLVYGALLESLRRGVMQLRRHLPISVSLPGLLDELLWEAAGATPAAEGGLSRPGAAVAAGEADPEDLAAWLLRDEAGLLALIRRLARDPPALARLIAGAAPASLRRLLAILDREHAELVQHYLTDVVDAHRVEPLVALEPAALTDLLWLLALLQLVRESGSRFNARRFLLGLLRELAAQEAVDFTGLLATLRRGLARITRLATPKGKFLGLLDEVLEEMASEAEAADWAAAEAYLRQEGNGKVAPAALFLRLYQLAPRRMAALLKALASSEMLWMGAGSRLLAVLTPGEIAGMLAPDDAKLAGALTGLLADVIPDEAQESRLGLLRRLALGEVPDLPPIGVCEPIRDFDRMEALAQLLRSGALPWWAVLADPPLLSAAAVALLAGLAPEALRAIFQAAPAGQRARMALRLAGLLGGAGVAALLARLAPWAAALSGPLTQLPAEQLPAVRAHLLNAVLQGGSLDIGTLLAEARAQAGTPMPALPVQIEGGALEQSLAALAGLASLDDPVAPVLLASLAAGHGSALVLLTRRLAPAQQARLRPLLRPGEDGADMYRAVLAMLAGTPAAGSTAAHSEALLIEAAIALADEAAPEFREVLAAMLAQPKIRLHWAERLPERLMGRLVQLSVPYQARLLLDTIAVLGTAWHEAAPSDRFGESRRQSRLPWATLLTFLSERPAAAREPRALAARLVGVLAGGDAKTARGILARAQALAVSRGHAWLQAVLQTARPAVLQHPSALRRALTAVQGAGRRLGFSLAAKPEPAVRSIYIGNAGLVLAGPFLPHLFGTLELLGEDADGKPSMRDFAAASRAVHLLQWLADARMDAPEPELVLNKLLCGLEPEVAIEAQIALTDREMTVGMQLLKAMLANWTIISTSSVEALRETFLQREGRLERQESDWALQVERKTLDVLVDRVTWGFGMIYNPWQRAPLRTTW